LAQGEKLRCVSYAPFHRPGQTPFDETLTIPRQQIEEDLRALAALTDCVRTYSTNMGLNQVSEVASALGLKVLLGAWIGYDQEKNTAELERAMAVSVCLRLWYFCASVIDARKGESRVDQMRGL
ncbi:MAG: hypothetical protein LBI87_13515, partial [Candidatus Accumulibacter sp.]|nr:hypothetical protein [Accumulibacter sp.]